MSTGTIRRHRAAEAAAKADAKVVPESAESVEKPSGNATTSEWRAYALSQGASEADLEGLGRDAIRDLCAD